MRSESSELHNRISSLSDEDLVAMANVNPADYRKEALDYAAAELTKRGLSPAVDTSLSGVANAKTEIKYERVGGWLLFFCITLVIVDPLITLLGTLDSLGMARLFPLDARECSS